MYAKVKLLRQRGKRLSNRDISKLEPLEGDIAMVGHQWSMEYVLTLRERNNQVADPLLTLFNARMVGMGNERMAFYGEERLHGEDGPAYVQEWSVLVEAR